MGVMTEPRSEGESSHGEKRLDGKLSSASRLTGAEKIKEMTTTEETGLNGIGEGILDENASVDVSKERRPRGSRQDGDEHVDKHVNTTMPSKADATQENDVTDDIRLKNLEADGHVAADADGRENGEKGENGEEGEAQEDEEGPPEMTPEEKEAMREAVKDGNVDLLEDLLDKPRADINMVYFQENLLMTAIKAGQVLMAEFLLDNGVNPNFSTTLMQMKETGGKHPTQHMEWYKYTCRQMAYDRDMFDIVEIIDVLNGCLFPGVKPRERIPLLRRPLRSPSPSGGSSDSDNDDFSSTSADDFDISGEGQSSVDGEGRRLCGEGDASRRGSGDASEDRQGSAKRTRNRSEKSDDMVEEGEGELSGSVRRMLLSEELVDRDSGHNSDDVSAAGREANKERRRKKKNKNKEEKDSEHAGSLIEGEVVDKDTAKGPRSIASKVQGDQAGGSKGAARSSEPSADGATVVNDEGYETMSPSPSLSPAYRHLQQQQLAAKFQTPSIPVKTTKAFLALRRSRETHLYRHIPAKYNEARPLLWRKVKSTGSYTIESPLWHQTVTLLPPSPKSAWTAQETDKTTTTTPTTTMLTNSGKPMIDSTSYLREMNSGNTTKPKILRPSQRKHSASSPLGGIVASPAEETQTRSGTPVEANTDKLYPLKQKVPQPNYMKMTTSCFVKRKLEPNFTNVYRSLDFVHPSASSKAVSGVRSADVGIQKKSASVTNSGKTATGMLPSVAELPPAPNMSSGNFASSRRKTFTVLSSQGTGSMGGRQADVLHNIRNNSCVIQTPRLKPAAAAKSR